MATTTPNYGWDVPTSTDYVKDGATAIETLGDDIDATLWTALGGAYPGLRLVKKQTILSGVTSVTVTDAFSATYENYLIQIAGGASSAETLLNLKLGATTTGYFGQYIYSSWNNTILVDATTTGVHWLYAGSASASGLSMNATIYSPQLAKTTRVSAPSTGALATYVGSFNGMLNNTTQYTSFIIAPNSGTITGGTIYVYGYGAS